MEVDMGVREDPPLPEAGRGEEGPSPLRFPEESSPANTLILAPEDSILTSGPPNCKRTHLLFL